MSLGNRPSPQTLLHLDRPLSQHRAPEDPETRVPPAIDGLARQLVLSGDVDRAATETLRAYGSEIFSFLLAIHKSEADADDVFSHFSERLWQGLPGFAWHCPLRAWAYVVARNESHRFHDGLRRRARREAPLSPEAVSEAAAQVRTATLSLYRSENKTALMELRRTLSTEEQTLLILRVDRGLEWNDLALVFHDGASDSSPEELKRSAARLRKRFQLVKEKLLDLGRKQGLVKNRRGD